MVRARPPTAPPQRPWPLHALTQPLRRRSRPASDPSRPAQPLEPILFPKLRILICRLPLPNIVLSLEAVHLGNLLRIWVPAPALKFTLAFAQGFPTGRRQRTGQPREAPVLYGNNVPISGPADSRESVPYKAKENSSRGPTADVLLVPFRVHRPGPHRAPLKAPRDGRSSSPGFGNINPDSLFALGQGATTRQRATKPYKTNEPNDAHGDHHRVSFRKELLHTGVNAPP